MSGSTSSATAISTMRLESASERPKVGCAVKTIPLRARAQRVLNVSNASAFLAASAFDESANSLSRFPVYEADLVAQVARAR